MKLVCEVRKLANALSTVMPSVGTGKIKPILAGALLRAEDGEAKLIGTNLELSLVTRFPADVSVAGSCIVNPKRLAAIIAECSGNVTITCDGLGVKVRTETGKFDLPYMDPAEFPVSEPKEGVTFVVPRLAEMVRKVSWACSRKAGANGTSTGVLLEVISEVLTCIGTDMNSAAIVESPVKDAKDCSVIIPNAAVGMVEKMVGDVSVTLADNEACFTDGDTTLTTRILAGKFPPVRKIVPKKSESVVKVNAESFLSSVKQASAVSDAEDRRINLEFTAMESKASAAGEDAGSCEVVVNTLSVMGPEVSISFFQNYLIGVMRVATGEISIEMNGGRKTALFRASDVMFVIQPLE